MTFLSQKILMIAVAATLYAGTVSGFAATANVTVNNTSAGGFVPATTNIFVGDRVIWTWPSGSTAHNVSSTSTPQAWTTSAILSGPATFTNTFTATGPFPYKCTVHGFTGAVNVSAASAPPTLAITGPANNAVFAEPANVTIVAGVTNGSGTVTNVQFRAGATIVANVTSAPFSATASNLTAGTYTLMAIASANGGLSATNTTSISVVTPVTVSLGSPKVVSSAGFQFSYAASVGLSYVVQRSAGLTSTGWVSLVTNVAASNPVLFTDTHATNGASFYRVGQMPNP